MCAGQGGGHAQRGPTATAGDHTDHQHAHRRACLPPPARPRAGSPSLQMNLTAAEAQNAQGWLRNSPCGNASAVLDCVYSLSPQQVLAALDPAWDPPSYFPISPQGNNLPAVVIVDGRWGDGGTDGRHGGCVAAGERSRLVRASWRLARKGCRELAGVGTVVASLCGTCGGIAAPW